MVCPPDPPDAVVPDAIRRIARALAGYERPWGIAGGWALDLWHGAVSREHHDVDVAVLRDDQLALRAQLRDYTWTVIDRGAARPWLAGERVATPLHELHGVHQGTLVERLEILMNDHLGGEWMYRRDFRVRLDLGRAFVHTNSSLPVLAPEIVLLYKAKQRRAVDESDFRTHAPHLSASGREWLAQALAMAHPKHPWLAALG